MLISRYFVWFILFSVLGWMFETTYCTIKEGEWRNRGFLYGPLCPIYGSASVTLIALSDFLNIQMDITLLWWQVFLISFFGSMVFEYSISWGLEKLFHAYWWDYSNMPLNINGRICFPASVTFGLFGLLISNVLDPWCKELTAPIPPVAMEVLALLLMAILAADLTLTVSALTDFENVVADMEANLDMHMELFVYTIQERQQDATKRLSEERERFSLENMEHAVSHMSSASRHALGRVSGFRLPTQNARKDSAERLLQLIKSRVNWKK